MSTTPIRYADDDKSMYDKVKDKAGECRGLPHRCSLGHSLAVRQARCSYQMPPTSTVAKPMFPLIVLHLRPYGDCSKLEMLHHGKNKVTTKGLH